MAASVCILKQEDFNMNALTHKEIIAWLRANGQKLMDAADAVQGAFAQPGIERVGNVAGFRVVQAS